MSMDLTGITNQNEYYTNHYFSSIFEENSSDTISKWRAEAKDSEEVRTPWALLRDAARQFYSVHDRFLRSKFDTQTLANIRSLADIYLSALGYPAAEPEWVDIDDARYCLNSYLEKGWIPIIAHAERYCWTFASVENIRILKDMGCLVQVNYYDLIEEPNHDIRTCAQELLKAELVDMMGSDAHRTNHRPPKLVRGARYIRENCRAEYADDILWRNVERYLKA